MNLSFFIARRYLISKKSNNAINIISWISIIAIAITTGALIVILSAMNGLTGAVAGLYNTFEPDLKITAAKGKYFTADDALLQKIKTINGVEAISQTYSDKALIKNNEKQTLVSVKGVDDDFTKVTKVDSSIVEGKYQINQKKNFIVLGRGVANILGVNIMQISGELSLLSPNKGRTSNLNAQDNFTQVYLTPNGLFSLNDEFDYQFVFVSLKTARELFSDSIRVSAIEVKCNNKEEVQKKLISMLGNDYVVKNRYQLNDVLFKTLETEKLATFIILAFILIIATFNIIGALTMLIIEKKKDIKTLFSLGADLSLVRNIFMREGFLITGVGATIGLILGLFVCWLQIKFHLVTFGDEFVIPYYPIELQAKDFVWIFCLIMLIGFFAALYPVRFFTKSAKLD
ncbi:MAG: ABC transporter permease [Sphingobacteriaceae bacterium]|nr:ABC transporter permease [Sphingobacteriaceae bacterium]